MIFEFVYGQFRLFLSKKKIKVSILQLASMRIYYEIEYLIVLDDLMIFY